jgi:hypothetical protein
MSLPQQYYDTLLRRANAWRFGRFVQLVGGLVVLSLGIFYVYQAYKRASAALTWDQEAVLYYPLGTTLFTLGAGLCVHALTRWRGDPVLHALLELLNRAQDEQRSEPSDNQTGQKKGEKGVRP